MSSFSDICAWLQGPVALSLDGAVARPLDMASPARASSRLCGKSALGGVSSPLELERRCGHRLRQVRGADLLLGIYDVMRLADSEFGLRVSRDVAGRWLELCGAAASSVRALEIESVEELERRFGPFLRTCGFVHAKWNELLALFDELLPHVQVEERVLLSWARNWLMGQEPDVSHLTRGREAPYRCASHAPRVHSYEDLVSKCGPLLDCFDGPAITCRGLCRAMVACHIDVSIAKPPGFVRDYVALRRAGFLSQAPVLEVPPDQVDLCLADCRLHGASPAGMQRCALERGVAIAWTALRKLSRSGPRLRKIVCWTQVEGDRELRGDLERLLAKHLASHGVHRVCEELLSSKRVRLPFKVLRARLLGDLLRLPRKVPEPPSLPPRLGRPPVDRCWRVMFAYVERALASFGGSRVLGHWWLCFGPVDRCGTFLPGVAGRVSGVLSLSLKLPFGCDFLDGTKEGLCSGDSFCRFRSGDIIAGF